MKKILTSLFLISMILPVSLFAHTSVTNSVTTHANTGGGREASTSVYIHTEVNGETVTHIDEYKTSSDGSVSIEKNIEYVAPIEHTKVVHEFRKIDIEGDMVSEGEIYIDLTDEEKDEVEHDQEQDVSKKGRVSLWVSIKHFFKTYVFWW